MVGLLARVTATVSVEKGAISRPLYRVTVSVNSEQEVVRDPDLLRCNERVDQHLVAFEAEPEPHQGGID